jgi:hypothetical protein
MRKYSERIQKNPSFRRGGILEMAQKFLIYAPGLYLFGVD